MEAIDHEIHELFSISPEERIAAVTEPMSRRLGRAGGRMFLYGAGQLGQTTASALRRCGMTPEAFVDGNPLKHGTDVEGIPVISLDECVATRGLHSLVVVTVYNCCAVLAELKARGIEAVTYAQLAWTIGSPLVPYLSIDRPHGMWEHLDAIRRAGRLWADRKSQMEYLGQLRWSLTLDPMTLPPHDDPKNTYFDADIVQWRGSDVFLDCGAFDGDSLAAFIERCPSYQAAIGLEPDPANRAACSRRFGGESEMRKARVQLLPYAASDRRDSIRFQAMGTVGSSVGEHGIEVEAVPIDELGALPTPTFLKMDIEGAEPMALRGAARVMRDHAPTIAACLYHDRAHLWEIPLQIAATQPRYTLFLRRYADECWENICYAKPPKL